MIENQKVTQYYLKPIVPVAQNVHPILQPTCDEMQTVERALCNKAGLFFLSYLYLSNKSITAV